MKSFIPLRLSILALFLSAPAFGQNKADVESMLQQFVQNGVINTNEASAAKAKLKKLTPQQWAEIKAKAHQMKNSGQFNSQATTNSFGAAAAQIDTSSAQFQKVMDQMKSAIDSHQAK